MCVCVCTCVAVFTPINELLYMPAEVTMACLQQGIAPPPPVSALTRDGQGPLSPTVSINETSLISACGSIQGTPESTAPL